MNGPGRASLPRWTIGLQNLPMSDLTPRWLTELGAGRSVQGLIRDFPAQEREILEPQGIVSILVVPIKLHGTLWGFLGFDSVRAARPWGHTEEHVLNIVSANLGAAIARRHVQEELASSNRTLTTILDSLPVDVYVSDLATYRILFMNRHIKESFGHDCAENSVTRPSTSRSRPADTAPTRNCWTRRAVRPGSSPGNASTP